MNTNRFSPFSNVDGSSDPNWCIDRLDAQHASSFVRRRKARCFQLLDLPRAQTVLDIGCGTGLDCKSMIEAKSQDGLVVGVDLSRVMLHEAQARQVDYQTRITLAQQNALNLGFASDVFDSCFAERMFQHIGDAKAALHEMWRVTKPGGRLVVIEPDHETVVIDAMNSSVTRRFIHWRSDKLAYGSVAQHLYGWLRSFGCQQVSVEPWVQVFTDYNERKQVAPYLEEMLIAEQEGAVGHEEAAAWIGDLQRAIDEQRFFAMQTSLLVYAVK